jgi:hypothetical protein
MDTADTANVVHALSSRLRKCYVYPDIAEQICMRLNEHLLEGRYAEIKTGMILARNLTLDMQEVCRDEHLWVKWHFDPLPESDEQLRLNPAWQAERRLEAQIDNYGLHKAERLPGNVGYLDIHYLHRPAWGGDTASAAMNLVSNTDALIIDLRNCTGGYPGMTALFCSYLFGEDSLHLDSIYWRDDDVTQQFWTSPHIAGKRYGDKPVYALISRTTFSGGEQFAYILQTRKRAMLIGEKTDGGAHPGASYRIHPHFEVFVPIGRSISPITGTDWEGVGITPDVATSTDQAFKTAYTLALNSIITSLGESPTGVRKVLVEQAQFALLQLE